MRRSVVIVAAVLGIAWVGCSSTAPESNTLTIQLPQTACPSNLALSGAGTCYFGVGIYAGPWTTSEPEAVFAEKCVAYTGDLITITGIQAGDDMTVVLVGYSDPTCGEAVLVGARGGVSVREGEEQGGIWFIPTFRDGGFTAFPGFGRSIREAAADTSCSKDVECRTLGADGVTYEISPAAFCDADAGHCRMPSSTFPLNMGTPRALHTATTLGDGRIALVGGVTHNPKPGEFLGTDEIIEIFDPVDMTWSRPAVSFPGGVRLALHATVSLGGSKIAMYGGARQVNLAIKPVGLDTGGKQYLDGDLPDKDVTETANILDLVHSVDLSTGEVSTSALSAPRARLHAARVPDGVLVTGGLEPVGTGTGAVASVFADLCGADGNACSALDSLRAPRVGHCGLCLDETGGACEKLLLFGGLPRDLEDDAATAIGEIFSGGSLTEVGLLVSDVEGNVVNPICVRGAGNSYLVGGTERFNRAPSVMPALLATTGGDAKISGTSLGNVGGIVSPFRVHSAAVELADGRVLVSGGLDDSGTAVASAYVIEGQDVVDQKTMTAARFGHTATLLTTGPLAGSVLIAGGLTADADGNISVVSGAELFVP